MPKRQTQQLAGAEGAGLGREPASGFIFRGPMAAVSSTGRNRAAPARPVNARWGAIASVSPNEGSGRGWLKPVAGTSRRPARQINRCSLASGPAAGRDRRAETRRRAGRRLLRHKANSARSAARTSYTALPRPWRCSLMTSPVHQEQGPAICSARGCRVTATWAVVWTIPSCTPPTARRSGLPVTSTSSPWPTSSPFDHSSNGSSP
jgi:hypothetical protein